MSEAFVVCDGWMTASAGKNKAEVLICSELLGNSTANFWPLSWWRKMSTNHQLLYGVPEQPFHMNAKIQKGNLLWIYANIYFFNFMVVSVKIYIFFFYIYLISVFVADIFYKYFIWQNIFMYVPKKYKACKMSYIQLNLLR